MSPSLIKKNNVTLEGNVNAGKTIIFAHGFGTDKTSWDIVKQAFAADYRLVLYDNVGGGNADPKAYSPLKYNTLNTYADDLLAIAKELDLKDAIVVGHSVSSMICLIAAVKAPQCFSKMILIGASPRYLDDDGYFGGFNQQVLNDMYENMTNNYYAWVSGFSAVAMANPDKPELGEGFAKTLAAIRPDIALSVAKVIFESDIRKELTKLNKPTLLIQTKEDIAVPAAVAEYLNENISGSTLTYVNATGHFPHISAPQEIISAIKAFI
ncbi:alpha/beta fold hydrolase [Pedobacter metabolipauper]|uniref:Sigma-B regulation protein RsbQ n=1 Tax=Pedobacter metabolipauper TaxID=425513 RepID=A0A4V3D0M3_9SPHI|nr:alpha/beta hydrolase [Pedobacter metabolipauper]TDQ06330.1 sigma-B regulation protein RsbQ [Pedobacter metabolipauper]